jgi:hypothetical protein
MTMSVHDELFCRKQNLKMTLNTLSQHTRYPGASTAADTANHSLDRAKQRS